jgi:hypothetical protein
MLKQENWWNASFEDLMSDLGAWLKDREMIQVVHLDWKFVQKPNEDTGYWYMLVIYK